MRIDHPPPTPPSGFSSGGADSLNQLMNDLKFLQSDLSEQPPLDPTDPMAQGEFLSDLEATQTDIQNIQKSGGKVPPQVTQLLAQMAPKTHISINTILQEAHQGDYDQAREDVGTLLQAYKYPNSSTFSDMIQKIINSFPHSK